MLSYQVCRDIEIDTTPESLIEFISDFKNWPEWSPWLIMERGCPLIYSGEAGQVDSGYEWSGNLVGAGGMVLTEKSPTRLVMALSFFRPFKSTATVKFNAEKTETGAKLSWIMESKVPWFLFFLKNMFKSMIGMDYDRGLLMLKSQIETGEVHSELKLVGESNLPETHYIALKNDAGMQDMGPTMQDDIVKLDEFMTERGIEPSGAMFALYDSMDMATMHFDFHTCYPICEPIDVPEPFICGHLKASDTYVVEHIGAYHFLGNAWSMANMAARHNKVPVKRKPLGIELYVDNPNDVEITQLRTQILLFKK
ncbi:putative polyketide cylcases/dehydrase fused with AraC binding domain [Vibrio nigripulchritudo MADA3029]|uniref:SRPBCC family protein n=1 Tax=Vibrio nigripulchritudo TaxID=28173 RepID=UPI0003B2425C|nr:SRPBCC family protein [Vibrio nigripulchritudo]CCN46370.1 putative polyketide cylcases/dehydrase fused with AraC binding domain [Vibrio nigripulchritudo MADA3020]CCN53440.1 putative polyketide cylcases/dehydrase fused with AraC binding domain [Vibrio nigripulchritudo MADA3021]CCN58393.1 putative polyketide cylcases/dehydrase fused with AraC binding domain [Vibrio nigripulchritudo MADA3029]BCL68726.1 transcriptional regulator [Vibrio nigripulchritudo]BDU30057.1 transcriptional regulator [Vib